MTKKTAFTLLLSGILTTGITFRILHPEPAYAANLVLTGDTENLSITPANEDLFRISALLPGESAASSIQISNRDQYAYTLDVEVKNLSAADEIDLADALSIRIWRDNMEIADFPAKGGQHALGRFAPGATAILQIAVDLPGYETTNEYQGKSANFQWIFTAISDNPGETGGGGGFGGGGSFGGIYTPVVVEEPAIPLGLSADTTDVVDIPDEEVPLGSIDVPTEDELVEIDEEDVPLGMKDMPKTGESSRIYNILVGFAICGFGFIILLQIKPDEK